MRGSHADRDFFVKHLEEIIQKLKIEKLIASLEKFTDYKKNTSISLEEKKEFSDLIFQSSAGYSSLIENDDKRNLLEAFLIPPLYDSQQLSQMMAVVNGSPETSVIFGNPPNPFIFQKLLTTLQSLHVTRRTLDTFLLLPRRLFVSNESLNEEDGRILEHSLLSEMENLIRNGAAPKDIEKVDGIERQKLLIEHRDVKLLERPQTDKDQS